MPKHRRSEEEPSLASLRAPANTAEYWPEAVGYSPVGARAGHPGATYPPPDGYDAAAAGPGWAASPQGHPWQEQEWEDWRDWAPPPALHPDHPSAPVPRVLFPADHPSGPMPAPPVPGPPDLPRRRPAGSARTRNAPLHIPDSGYDDGNRREAGPFGPGRAARIAQDARDYAAATCEAAEREAAAITRQAADRAATMREAAERQAAAITQQAADHAAAIREAAEREAAELRARLDSMSGELGRVAAYVTERLTTPAMPMIALALPEATPAPLSTRPAPPAATPAERATGPDSRPAGPAKPRTAPAKKPQKPSRQLQAMRIAQISTAALVSFALVFGATEIGIHGLKFFVFREQGQGQSTDGPTDQQFLARQAAAAHHQAPKGRHAKKPQPAVTSTTRG